MLSQKQMIPTQYLSLAYILAWYLKSFSNHVDPVDPCLQRDYFQTFLSSSCIQYFNVIFVIDVLFGLASSAYICSNEHRIGITPH